MLLRVLSGAAVALAGLVMPLSAQGQAPGGKVSVITPYAKDITEPVKAAFEAANPGVTLDIQNREASAGVAYLEETRSKNQVDVFWASAPDAFESLKSRNLLQVYKPKAEGIPDRIGQSPTNDPQGFYSGFAASGSGIMWNERYAKANKLPEPKEWHDLAGPAYFDRVSMAMPSRSGSTHRAIETILQGEGWDRGWATLKAMSGNLRNLTEHASGVPDAVSSGKAGYGIVSDYLAFLAQASRSPVKFVYPSVTAIVPASIAIVANAPNKAGAEAFIEYLLSPAGQALMFDPKIRRLPVSPAAYDKAPAGYPDPFKDPRQDSMVKFDVKKSESRNEVVDALFDQLVTFQLPTLKDATREIHAAEIALARKDNAAAQALLGEARALIAAMPVTETQSAAGEVAGAFTGSRQKGTRQIELEQQWAAFARDRYAQAKAKAAEALKLAK